MKDSMNNTKVSEHLLWFGHSFQAPGTRANMVEHASLSWSSHLVAGTAWVREPLVGHPSINGLGSTHRLVKWRLSKRQISWAAAWESLCECFSCASSISEGRETQCWAVSRSLFLSVACLRPGLIIRDRSTKPLASFGHQQSHSGVWEAQGSLPWGASLKVWTYQKTNTELRWTESHDQLCLWKGCFRGTVYSQGVGNIRFPHIFPLNRTYSRCNCTHTHTHY